MILKWNNKIGQTINSKTRYKIINNSKTINDNKPFETEYWELIRWLCIINLKVILNL